MRINKFGFRSVVLMIGAAGALGFAGLGAGHADAGTNCVAVNGQQVQKVVGQGGCGAKAGAGSRASADETSGQGVAVAVADRGGNATARNLQPGSSALAGANSGGTAYSVTTGAKALSVAQARRGGVSASIGGWGGQAISGPQGVQCTGGFATAIDTTTGKACLHSGSIDLRN